MRGLVPPPRCGEIEAEVEEEIRAAFAFAEASPLPEASELFADVYKER
jgi:TPP-dependent pyruvate/acetoin dehydrogenase alpha subunit